MATIIHGYYFACNFVMNSSDFFFEKILIVHLKNFYFLLHTLCNFVFSIQFKKVSNNQNNNQNKEKKTNSKIRSMLGPILVKTKIKMHFSLFFYY